MEEEQKRQTAEWAEISRTKDSGARYMEEAMIGGSRMYKELVEVAGGMDNLEINLRKAQDKITMSEYKELTEEVAVIKNKIGVVIHNLDMAQFEMGNYGAPIPGSGALTPFPTNHPDIAIRHFSKSLAQAGLISGDQEFHIRNAIQSGFEVASEVIAATGATRQVGATGQGGASGDGYRNGLLERTRQVGATVLGDITGQGYRTGLLGRTGQVSVKM